MITVKEIERKDNSTVFKISSKTVELFNKDIFDYIHNLIYSDDIKICLLDGTEKILYKKYAPISDKSVFKTSPFDYQLDGLNFGLSRKNNFLLLDAPGLGKSLQILYLAQELKKRENIEHCLIICGVNTLKTNWKKEIEKHTDLSCRILGSRINKKGNLVFDGVEARLNDLKNPIEEFFVITNVETLRNDKIIKELNKGKNKFDIVVCDEIHTLKDSNSKQGGNFLKLKNFKYKIGATGTVLMNNPMDLFVPLKWLGAEKCSQSVFQYYYCNIFNHELLGYKHIKELKKELDMFSIRRTKDLLQLPEKTVIHELVDLNDSQQTFYNNIKNGIISQVDKVNMSTASILAMISRLRQATACPSILTTENIPSSKIDRACDLIDQIVSNNEKVVVFSTFKETLNVLMSKIIKYNPMLCTGDVPDNIISSNIDNFQNNDASKVMLATWSKMGTGITLTAASNVIFIDCAWTEAQNLQAEDRCHRIGSNKPVFVYYLWANNTIDLRVKELVEDKSMLFSYIVDDKIPPQFADKLRKIIADLK